MFIDLLDVLSSDLNFEYEIRQPKDGTYGAFLNGAWSGIIKDLDEKRGDLATVDLSVTKARSSVVDFTTGLYTSQSRLYVKTPKRSASWVTFMQAFDFNFMILLAGVAICLTLIFYSIFYFVNGETTIDLGTSVATVFLSFLGNFLLFAGLEKGPKYAF